MGRGRRRRTQAGERRSASAAADAADVAGDAEAASAADTGSAGALGAPSAANADPKDDAPAAAVADESPLGPAEMLFHPAADIFAGNGSTGGKAPGAFAADAWQLLHAAQSGDHLVLMEALAYFNRSSGLSFEHCKNTRLQNPLHLAAAGGHLDCLEVLVREAGASGSVLGGSTALWALDARDHVQRTPLHYSSMSGSLPCVRCLVDAGASRWLVDSNGDTPLHLAVAADRRDVVAALATGDPGLLIKNNAGQTAADLATHTETAALLEAAHRSIPASPSLSMSPSALHPMVRGRNSSLLTSSLAATGQVTASPELSAKVDPTPAPPTEDPAPAPPTEDPAPAPPTEDPAPAPPTEDPAPAPPTKDTKDPTTASPVRGLGRAFAVEGMAVAEDAPARPAVAVEPPLYLPGGPTAASTATTTAATTPTSVSTATSFQTPPSVLQPLPGDPSYDLYAWLAGRRLQKLYPLFMDNLVDDLEALALLTDEDLRELNVPVGARRKILHNLTAPAAAASSSSSTFSASPSTQSSIQRSFSELAHSKPPMDEVWHPSDTPSSVDSPRSNSMVSLSDPIDLPRPDSKEDAPVESPPTESLNSDMSPLLFDSGCVPSQADVYWYKLIKLARTNAMAAAQVRARSRENRIPARLRGYLWFSMSNGHTLIRRFPGLYAKLKAQELQASVANQIKMDLGRTYSAFDLTLCPGPRRSDAELEGLTKNVLVAYANLDNTIQYCQGMGFLAGMLLLHLDEEEAFWTMVDLMEQGLRRFYANRLAGMIVDCAVFSELLRLQLPKLAKHLERLKIQPSAYLPTWFMSLFCGSIPFESVLRIWDAFICEGTHTLFTVAIAIIELCQGDMLDLTKEMWSQENLLLYVQKLPTARVIPQIIMPFVYENQVDPDLLRDLRHRFSSYGRDPSGTKGQFDWIFDAPILNPPGFRSLFSGARTRKSSTPSRPDDSDPGRQGLQSPASGDKRDSVSPGGKTVKFVGASPSPNSRSFLAETVAEADLETEAEAEAHAQSQSPDGRALRDWFHLAVQTILQARAERVATPTPAVIADGEYPVDLWPTIASDFLAVWETRGTASSLCIEVFVECPLHATSEFLQRDDLVPPSHEQVLRPVLVESWMLWTKDRPSGDGDDSLLRDLEFKNLQVLLRSLYSYLRLMPVHRLARRCRLRNAGPRVSYALRTGPEGSVWVEPPQRKQFEDVVIASLGQVLSMEVSYQSRDQISVLAARLAPFLSVQREAGATLDHYVSAHLDITRSAFGTRAEKKPPKAGAEARSLPVDVPPVLVDSMLVRPAVFGDGDGDDGDDDRGSADSRSGTTGAAGDPDWSDQDNDVTDQAVEPVVRATYPAAAAGQKLQRPAPGSLSPTQLGVVRAVSGGFTSVREFWSQERLKKSKRRLGKGAARGAQQPQRQASTDPHPMRAHASVSSAASQCPTSGSAHSAVAAEEPRVRAHSDDSTASRGPRPVPECMRADTLLFDKRVKAPPRGPSSTINNILVTGPTGFLGIFVVHSLLEQSPDSVIHCLVRGWSPEHAEQRLQVAMEQHGIWKASYARRLEILQGDLGQPRLGLTPERFAELGRYVDVIVHCGAQHSEREGYDVHRPSNVLGTLEVLRLASTHIAKRVTFVSCLDVFPRRGQRSMTEIKENHSIEGPDELLAGMTGYAQSKWVGEMMMGAAARRGIPVQIVRAGLLRWCSHSGIGRMIESDFFFNLIGGLLLLGRAPKIPSHLTLDIPPVDYAGQVVAHLALTSSGKWSSLGQWLRRRGMVFHLVDPVPVSFAGFLAQLQSLGSDPNVQKYLTTRASSHLLGLHPPLEWKSWRTLLQTEIGKAVQGNYQRHMRLYSWLDYLADIVEIACIPVDGSETAAALRNTFITPPDMDNLDLVRFVSACVKRLGRAL